MTNYLQTANPWRLPAPPAWWLQQLADYDRQLVVFPSQLRPAYLLARRRQASNAIAELARLDKDLVKQSAGMDGDILAAHNLIYVRHLIGNTIQRPAIFQWLRDHDTIALGGHEKVSTLIESEEGYRAELARQKMVNDIDYRAKDAWRSYQARTGRRSGYTKSGVGAKQMPVEKFGPNEPTTAMFSRD